MGSIPELRMIWMDHSAFMSGPIPSTFAALNLSVLEMQYSNFSGALPPLNYRKIPDCNLYNEHFNHAATSKGKNT